MPRPSQRGFLRLSLGSCPIYLSQVLRGKQDARSNPVRRATLRRRHARNPFACARCSNLPRSMWTRANCPIGVKGSRVLRHRHRGSSTTMLALMEIRVPPPPGSRFGRMTPACRESPKNLRVFSTWNGPAPRQVGRDGSPVGVTLRARVQGLTLVAAARMRVMQEKGLSMAEELNGLWASTGEPEPSGLPGRCPRRVPERRTVAHGGPGIEEPCDWLIARTG